MSYSNKYIVFEGIDACGKSTQAKLFCEFLKEQSMDVYFTKEPGGTDETKIIRDILLNKHLTPKTSLFLFLADRAIHSELIKDKLKKSFVVSDRSMFSTIAYQGFGDGLDLDFIEYANSFATGSMLPNLTIILDITLETMNRRLKNKDVMESKGEDFFKRVKDGYRYVADKYENVYILNGEKHIDEIFQEVIEIWKSL